MQKDKMGKTAINKIAEHPLQTWEWGEFRKATGNKVLRTQYGQITIHQLPFSSYKIGIFLKGPEPTTEMLSDLKEIGKKHNLIFIKLEPALGFIRETPLEHKHSREHLTTLLIESGAVKGKPFFTPTSFWIDLTKSEEELMKGFHHKTRYNIRLAERKGVTIVEDNSDKAFDRYIELQRETVELQRFYNHNEQYHRLMWQHLHQTPITNHRTPIAHLLTARYKNEIITTWVLFIWKNMLYYPYGARTEKHKNLMANNLIMWEAIKFGKQHKLQTFDLWGREPGKGFTKFKEGYNPEVVEFLGSWDLITSSLPLYNAYRLAETARWSALRLKSKFSKPKF